MTRAKRKRKRVKRKRYSISSFIRNLNELALWNPFYSLWGFCLCLEKEEGEEEIQQGEEWPPLFCWPVVPLHWHTVCQSFNYSATFSKQANNFKSNEPCFYCVLVKHSSSSSSSSSSDSSSSSSSESEDEVKYCKLRYYIFLGVTLQNLSWDMKCK